MGNIYDYLSWRGDLDFEQSCFNEIDNLICSRISYFPFEKILFKNKMTIKELYNYFINQKLNKNTFAVPQDIELLKKLSETKRYKKVVISNFISKFDRNLEQQFAAVTIDLKNIVYISYRGTDNTFIGWKEDFNMTFRENVPAQLSALEYLNKNSNHEKIILGGHSKGGNIAIYAALYCSNEIQDKIISIYTNDSPGFQENIINSEEYNKIKNKIYSFIPQTSIIGKLLNSNNNYKVVLSNQKLILQHDLYSWQMQGNHFIYQEDVDKESKTINKVINEWLNRITMEEREKTINTVYNIISSTNVNSFKELDIKWFQNAKLMIGSYKNISKQDKKLLNKVLEYLFVTIKNNIFQKNK